MRILITGGAGFVGSLLATGLRQRHADWQVVALDNLRRRGSELNLARLADHGVERVHGDIRIRTDLDDLPGTFDVVIEASAEPSVHAGHSGSPVYVLDANLVGTLHCLELARRRSSGVIFLSTSRVYTIDALRGLPLDETGTRLTPAPAAAGPGWSAAGIAEGFDTDGPRSFYGASKLASEAVLQEYARAYDVPSVIDRCGVIAGPGQFGKADQGVFSLWVAHHCFGLPLSYVGFGGRGLQVRDLLHPADLLDLVEIQIDRLDGLRADRFNVGGGPAVSTSLLEWTAACRQATGRDVPVGSEPATADVDVPWYVSDTARVTERFGWKPTRGLDTIATETASWIRDNETALRPILAGGS